MTLRFIEHCPSCGSRSIRRTFHVVRYGYREYKCDWCDIVFEVNTFQ